MRLPLNLRMQMNSMPIELDVLERKIRQLEIEREAIKRENDTKKLEELNREIAELSDERADIRAKWQGEKEVVEGIQKAKGTNRKFKV
jgi:ATP-dependent Clp protease ATP-binding subunit ClpB